MNTAQLIVCEPTGRWAAALRRQLAGRLTVVQACRSLHDCDRLLDESPASFVALAVTGQGFADALAWLARLGAKWPLARAAALAQRGTTPHQGALREAGAVHVVHSTRELAPLVEIALRHLDRAPVHEMALTEEIESNLPWGSRTEGE